MDLSTGRERETPYQSGSCYSLDASAGLLKLRFPLSAGMYAQRLQLAMPACQRESHRGINPADIN